MDPVALFDEALGSIWLSFSSLLPQLILALLVLVIVFVIYRVLTTILYHALRKTVRRKLEIALLMKIWRYGFLFVAVITLVLAFSGSLAATGISIGLMSAALGWALQKPITGIAAWLMLIVKKPFKVGDRVLIDNIQGDISDLTMFYIELAEFGGTIAGDEYSGRTILIPTSLLFEKPITNYTKGNDYILDEISTEYTYESDLKKAEKIMLDSAKHFTKDVIEKLQQKPYTRVFFNPNGMRVKVRYSIRAKDRQQAKSDITRGIYRRIMRERDMQFAYPHTEVVFGKQALPGHGSSRARTKRAV